MQLKKLQVQQDPPAPSVMEQEKSKAQSCPPSECKCAVCGTCNTVTIDEDGLQRIATLVQQGHGMEHIVQEMKTHGYDEHTVSGFVMLVETNSWDVIRKM